MWEFYLAASQAAFRWQDLRVFQIQLSHRNDTLPLVAARQVPLWLAPGIASLVLFAWLLTLSATDAACRAYPAYGGIYIAASLLWLWLAEGVAPDR
jgi:hypothetical protein